MTGKLKTAARGAFGGDEIDRILSMDLARLRMDLIQRFQVKTLTEEQYNDFVDRVSQMEDVGDQKEVIAHVLEHKRAASAADIDLSTPARQFLWAVALTRLMHLDEKGPVTRHPIWAQLQENVTAGNQEIIFAKAVDKALRNEEITFGWGAPGTWFYYNLGKFHINRDFYFSLLMGFEHVNVIDMHEMGHGEQSNNSFTPELVELAAKVKKYIDPTTAGGGQEEFKNKTKDMTQEEVMEVSLASREWHLRHRLWHMVEDDCADNFAVRMSQLCTQNFQPSKNYAATVLQGLGQVALGQDREIPVEITSKMPPAVQAAKKQELEFMADPLPPALLAQAQAGDITPPVAQKLYNQVNRAVWLCFAVENGLFADSRANWERFRVYPAEIDALVDVSGVPGAQGMTAFEYLKSLAGGPNGIHTLQPQISDRWFGKARYVKKVEETTQARIAVNRHIWDVYLQKFADILLQDHAQKVMQQLMNGQCPDGLEGDVGGTGSTPGEADENARRRPGEGGGPGWGQDPAQQSDGGKSQPRRVGDMSRREVVNDKLTPEQRKAMKEAAEKEKQKRAESGQPATGAGDGRENRGVDLAGLAKGSWEEYKRRILELRPVIDSVGRAYEEARRRQERVVRQESRAHAFLPPGGGFRKRLDRDKALRTLFRQVTGQKMELDDFKKFRDDKTVKAPCSIEIFYMIDGSGSMPAVALAGGVSAMEVALQSAAIGYQAAIEKGIDAYIIIWGGDIVVVATPETDPQEVGRRLEALKNGTFSGTSLEPGLSQTVQILSKHVCAPGTVSGSTHIQLFSDGDIFDGAEAGAALEAIIRNGRNISIDVAVLKPGDRSDMTSMEQVFLEAQKKSGSRSIGVYRGEDPRVIPIDLAMSMLRRVRQFKVKTEPDTEKRRCMKALYAKLSKNKK